MDFIIIILIFGFVGLPICGILLFLFTKIAGWLDKNGLLCDIAAFVLGFMAYASSIFFSYWVTKILFAYIITKIIKGGL